MTDRERTHYRTCHLCEAVCGIEIRVRGSEILSIRGDDADPFSRGHICPKAVAIKDIHEDPDRLRHPVRRNGAGWERISWNEALDEVASRLVEIQAKHGNDSVATYFGNPQVHSYTALLGGTLFARSLRTHNRFTATSVDQLPHHFAAYFMYGHQLLIPVADLDRTQFLLAIGANPVVSNGSLMTAPDVANRLKAIRRRGGRVVVIDPRHTETAKLADEHHFIRPGSDALFLLALLHVIFSEGLARPGRLESVANGMEQIARISSDYPPERVAQATGVGSEQIRLLARGFAAAESAVCYGRMGASTQRYGALTQWLIQVLNFVTGNLDRAGGAMFTHPAFDAIGLASGMGQRGAFNRRQTRVRGLPEFGGEFPVAALAEEILAPGKGQIRALVTSAGNPVISTPNGPQLEKAVASLEFMVSVDFYINETTRHADIILPPTFALERDHYDLIFHALRSRIEARYPGRRGDWRARLASNWLTPRRSLALGLRFGSYGPRWNPFARGITLTRLARQPHGVDLGPLEPCLPDRLASPGKRIDLAPAVLMGDIDRLSALLAPESAPAPDELLLIGRRDLRTNNSWMHNSRRMVKGPARCTLMMNPQDAARRGMTNGSLARVESRIGRVEIQVEVTDELMPGVVSIPHGWGHHRPGIQLGVAREHAGVSVNDLTDETAIDTLCGNAALNGVPVSVQPAERSAETALA